MTSLAAPPPEETPAPAVAKRPALAPSKSSHKSKSGSISGGLPTTSAPVQPRPNARPQVFVDPDGSEGRAAQVEETVSFPDVGTRKTRVKENIKEVSKMAGATLKQAGKSRRIASSGTAPKFVPFRDPEPDENANEKESMPPPPVPVNPSRRSHDGAVPQTPSRRAAFVPFRDPDAGTPSRGAAFVPFRDAEPEVQRTPSRRTAFVPFRDTDGEDAAPSTPKFTPYRDEVTSQPPALASLQTDPSPWLSQVPSTPSSSSLQDSVMKPKWTADRGVPMSSEAEILRKDPFKNYDDVIKPKE